jgi:hypothetical protein
MSDEKIPDLTTFREVVEELYRQQDESTHLFEQDTSQTLSAVRDAQAILRAATEAKAMNQTTQRPRSRE